MHTLVSIFCVFFASKEYPFKNIFDFATASNWDCVAAVERLPALYRSVFYILVFWDHGFYLCLVVTCWERTDLLALVCGV